jgi:UDP-3-O-[3-hydroxymyristoyl] glucosamine N-acyltransferase
MKARAITAEEIAVILNVPYTGKDIRFDGLNLCNRKSVHHSIISYITDVKYVEYLLINTEIKGLFVSEEHYRTVAGECPDLTCFIVDAPEDCFYRLHSHLYHHTPFYARPQCKPQTGENCHIHPSAVIEEDVIMGDNVTIGAYSVIKQGTVIGDHTAVGVGSIVGAPGFQLLKDKDGNNYLAEHAGGCQLGNHVSVGDHVVLSNSLFEGYTLVGSHTKIDNFVQVAHNCVIGRNCVLTAGVILAGSVTVEDNVWLAPNATVCNRVILEKGAFAGIGSVVIGDVKAGCRVFGVPARKIGW